MEEEIIKNFKKSIAIDDQQLNFENKNNFDFLKINLNSLKSLEWSDPNYLDNILKLDIYSTINTNSENFLNNIVDSLDVNKYNESADAMIETQIIGEFPDFIYEMVYINNIKKDDIYINELATLLITNGETIYGNAIIFKTYLSINDDTTIFININTSDIKYLLDKRVKTTVVIYDGVWSEVDVSGNLEDYAKGFFEDTFLKFETPFLKHNVNIWYEKLDGINNYVCGKLLNKPIYKCLFFTMISDEYRGSILLNEVIQIIKLSNYINSPYEPPAEWLIDEKDIYGRNKIKNKYRILEKACKKYLI